MPQAERVILPLSQSGEVMAHRLTLAFFFDVVGVFVLFLKGIFASLNENVSNFLLGYLRLKYSFPIGHVTSRPFKESALLALALSMSFSFSLMHVFLCKRTPVRMAFI